MNPRTVERLLFEFKERAESKIFVRIIYRTERDTLHPTYHLFTVTPGNKICGAQAVFMHEKGAIIGIPSRHIIYFPDEIHGSEEDVVDILMSVADNSDTDIPSIEAFFLQMDARCAERIGRKSATKLMFLADLMSIREMLKLCSNNYPEKKADFGLLEIRLAGFLEEQFRGLNEAIRRLSEFNR